MKEKVFSFILGGVLGFLMVCSMIAAFDYVCDLRDTEPETEAQTQTPAGVEYIFGIRLYNPSHGKQQYFIYAFPAQEFNCRERLRHKAARAINQAVNFVASHALEFIPADKRTV